MTPAMFGYSIDYSYIWKNLITSLNIGSLEEWQKFG